MQRERAEQQVGRQPRRAAAPLAADRSQNHGTRNASSQAIKPVIELHGRDVVREVRYQGSSAKISGGTKRPFMSGTCCRRVPPGSPRPGRPSTITNVRRRARRRSGAAPGNRAARVKSRSKTIHKHGRVDQEGDAEVGGEAKLRYARIVDQAGLHHVPAERACSAPSPNIAANFHASARAILSGSANHSSGSRKAAPIQSAEEPMDIFPPEDALETRRGSCRVDQRTGGLLVFPERFLPSGLVDGGRATDDRLPFDDRKPDG